jgi:hypothetical protein
MQSAEVSQVLHHQSRSLCAGVADGLHTPAYFGGWLGAVSGRPFVAVKPSCPGIQERTSECRQSWALGTCSTVLNNAGMLATPIHMNGCYGK